MNSKEVFKKLFALGTSTFLLAGVAVQAQGDRLVSSVGRYSVNTGNGTILIDTDDIEQNAEAIQALNGQLGGLSFKYGTEKDVGNGEDTTKGYYWSQDENGNWVKIGAVGNAIESEVLAGRKFSSEKGVDIIGTMPAPTRAEVGTRENPSSSLSVGSTSVALNNSTDTTQAHDDNVSHIDLGVGEQITIPHGYYNKDIVITNGVSNKGSLDFNPADNETIMLSEGYYESGTLSTESAYNAGYAEGYAQRVEGTVAYSYHHHTNGSDGITNSSEKVTDRYGDNYVSSTPVGCFTKQTSQGIACGGTGVWHSHSNGGHSCECSICGATLASMGKSDGWGWSITCGRITGYRTVYARDCGYTANQIIGATIIF